MDDDPILAERMKKLALLKDRGIDPYPAESHRTHTNEDFVKEFSVLTQSQSQPQKEIILAGRILSLRDQGGIVFWISLTARRGCRH